MVVTPDLSLKFDDIYHIVGDIAYVYTLPFSIVSRRRDHLGTLLLDSLGRFF